MCRWLKDPAVSLWQSAPDDSEGVRWQEIWTSLEMKREISVAHLSSGGLANCVGSDKIESVVAQMKATPFI